MSSRSDLLPDPSAHQREGYRSGLRLLAIKALPCWLACGWLSILIYGAILWHPYFAHSPWVIIAFATCAPYVLFQVIPSWLLYRDVRVPSPPPEPKDYSVDLFLPVYNEPYELVVDVLEAALRVRGNCRVWLLDDGADPALARLAASSGAGYLSRTERTNAKAGNINHALQHTEGEIIVVFDVDHVPCPEFLERSIGYFNSEKTGFVQTMITFRAQPGFWVSQAAHESSFDFYNPTCLGMNARGCVTMMGSNSLIRRTALLSIGGYRPGLAEDLATSLQLHAFGWQSAYVAEPLASGLAPATIAAWFTQQLKWARGVFELLLNVFPRIITALTPAQRLCYLVRMTKYYIGIVFAVHLVATVSVLLGGDARQQQVFGAYLACATPLAVSDLMIRQTALMAWKHPTLHSTSIWRAIALVFFSWPIYTLAWVMTILRLPLRFHATPKETNVGLQPGWILPQVVSCILLIYGVFRCGSSELALLSPVSIFALVQASLQSMVLAQRLRPGRLKSFLKHI